MVIHRVLDGGLVAAWNAGHPDRLVVAGDRIVAANGISGDGREIVAQLTQQQTLTLQVERVG